MAKSHLDWTHQHLRWSIASLKDALCQARKGGLPTDDLASALASVEAAKAALPIPAPSSRA